MQCHQIPPHKPHTLAFTPKPAGMHAQLQWKHQKGAQPEACVWCYPKWCHHRERQPALLGQSCQSACARHQHRPQHPLQKALAIPVCGAASCALHAAGCAAPPWSLRGSTPPAALPLGTCVSAPNSTTTICLAVLLNRPTPPASVRLGLRAHARGRCQRPALRGEVAERPASHAHHM